jgi:hypothetical protein
VVVEEGAATEVLEEGAEEVVVRVDLAEGVVAGEEGVVMAVVEVGLVERGSRSSEVSMSMLCNPLRSSHKIH